MNPVISPARAAEQGLRPRQLLAAADWNAEQARAPRISQGKARRHAAQAEALRLTAVLLSGGVV